MAVLNREFKNFEHILRHSTDKSGLTFITLSNKVGYDLLALKLDEKLNFILNDSRTVVTTTRTVDTLLVRYCYERNIRVETINLYSSSMNGNVYSRLPKKVNKMILLSHRANRVTDSILKYYNHFTQTYTWHIY